MVVEGILEPVELEASSMRSTWAAIDGFDLSAIEALLRLPKPRGQGWSEARCKLAVSEYRRFLKLIAKYPSKSIVPNRFIDQVWHTHILDTKKYARDCNAAFGYFLHHNPYLGLNDDEQIWGNAFDQTKALYEFEFGPEILPELAPAGCDAADLLPAGCDAADRLSAGCDAADFCPAGCDAADLRPAGCDAADLRPAGCDAADRLAA